MGSIYTRKNQDGTTKYTAQIRIKRKQKVVYQESQTFNKKTSAQVWMKKREAELALPGALDSIINKSDVDLAQVIARYLEEFESIQPLGRTKRLTLMAIAKTKIGSIKVEDVTSQVIVEYAQMRLKQDGVMPQTIGNDMAHLGAVLAVAKPAWGYNISNSVMIDARAVLKKLGLTSTSAERDRRPSFTELESILSHYAEMKERRRQEIDMVRVVGFALFSTRRMDEITRIKWGLMDEAGQRVLIKDMKNPGAKWGNDVWCYVPDEAWAIMMSVPRTKDGPFPYNSRSISASFTRACKFLQIEDLHFHDLRHEGVTRLFEMEWDIPKVASVSGHRDWNSMRRYTHLAGAGDKYEGWDWINRVIESRSIF
jgi:integrase